MQANETAALEAFKAQFDKVEFSKVGRRVGVWVSKRAGPDSHDWYDVRVVAAYTATRSSVSRLKFEQLRASI
jgi:hypothetical protein